MITVLAMPGALLVPHPAAAVVLKLDHYGLPRGSEAAREEEAHHGGKADNSLTFLIVIAVVLGTAGGPLRAPRRRHRPLRHGHQLRPLPAPLYGGHGHGSSRATLLADIKTAVSEAVTNCIVHAYPDAVGLVTLTAALYENGLVRITVTDRGVGIPDVSKAMEPLYTTGNPDERAGLGFAVMQSFMDKVKVSSTPGRGTRVTMAKRLEAKG